MNKTIGVVACFAALCGTAYGQATSTQQATSRLDAATGVAFGQAVAGSPSTATINVPGGMYAYITGIALDSCVGAGGTVATNVLFTSTNIQGLPSWTVSSPGTANTCAQRIVDIPTTPLKSLLPGTNVTIVSPTTAAIQYTVRIYYYLAP